MANDVTVEQIVLAIRMPYQLVGSTSRVINEPRSLDASAEGGIAFCLAPPDTALLRINNSAASVVIGPTGVDTGILDTSKKTCILCARPRLAFIRITRRFFADSHVGGVHSTAVVHDKAQLGHDVYVGPFTYIGQACVGDNTVIDGNVHIYDRVRIGKGCTIQAGAIIGSRGFGMERNESGAFEDFPHVGGVVIEDGVVVGAGVTIARGTLENTVIGRGNRIDALSEVSHNVKTGADCGLCASCVICGSVTVSNCSWIAPGSLIREGLRIGSGAMIGLGSVVVKDVRSGGVVYGVPARDRGHRSRT